MKLYLLANANGKMLLRIRELKPYLCRTRYVLIVKYPYPTRIPKDVL